MANQPPREGGDPTRNGQPPAEPTPDPQEIEAADQIPRSDDYWEGRRDAAVLDLHNDHNRALQGNGNGGQSAAANGTTSKEPPKWRPIRESLAAVEAEPVQWLWHHWLARGQFHLLAGPPGIGKTTLAVTLAAHLSVGAGHFQKAGKSLLVCLEDSWTFALRKRMEAAGADPGMVEVVRASESLEGAERRFRLEDDLPTLVADITAADNLGLIVLDPVIRVAGNQRDTHNANQVRSAVDVVEQLARRSNAAVLGITHLRKTGGSSGALSAGLLDAIMGSSAWAQIARVILACWKNEEHHPGSTEFDCSVGKLKNNLGLTTGVVPYNIEGTEDDPDTSVITFGKAQERSASGVLEGALPGKQEQAATWLLNNVQPGNSEPSGDLIGRAERSGIKKRTLQVARQKLGWDTEQTADGWVWKRPTEPGGAGGDDPLPDEVPF